MNFGSSTFSDSSDDSPAHNYTIKLKDIGGGIRSTRHHGKSPERSEASKELGNALRHIDGPSKLQEAVNKEKLKSLFESKGRSESRTRRAPPKPPSHAQLPPRTSSMGLNSRRSAPPVPTRRDRDEQVDYSPLTTPENIRSAKVRLSSFIQQDHAQMRSRAVSFSTDTPVTVKPDMVARTEDGNESKGETEHLKIRINQLERSMSAPPPSQMLGDIKQQPKSVHDFSSRGPLKSSLGSDDRSHQSDSMAEVLKDCADVLEKLKLACKELRSCGDKRAAARCIYAVSPALRTAFNVMSTQVWILNKDSQRYVYIPNGDKGHIDCSCSVDDMGLALRNTASNDRGSEGEGILPVNSESFAGPLKSVIESAIQNDINNTDERYPTAIDINSIRSVHFFEIRVSDVGSTPPSAYLMLCRQNPVTETDYPSISTMKSLLLMEALQKVCFALENTLMRLDTEWERVESAAAAEVQSTLRMIHEDCTLPILSGEIDSIVAINKAALKVTSLTEALMKSPISWLVLSTSQPELSDSSFCVYSSHDTQTCYNVCENNSTGTDFSTPLSDLIYSGDYSTESRRVSVVSTTLDKLRLMGLLKEETTHSRIWNNWTHGPGAIVKLLVVSFSIGDTSFACQNAIVTVIPSPCEMSCDFCGQQLLNISESFSKLVSSIRNFSNRILVSNISNSYTSVIRNISPQNSDKKVMSWVKVMSQPSVARTLLSSKSCLVVSSNLAYSRDSVGLNESFLGENLILYDPDSQSEVHIELDEENTTWLDTLSRGKSIVLPSLTPKLHTKGRRGLEALIKFVEKIDLTQAKSAIIVPLKCVHGLAFLVLVNINYSLCRDSIVEYENLQHFDPTLESIADAIISSVVPQLSAMIEQAYQSDKVMISSVSMERTIACQDTALDRIIALHQKSVCFAKWRERMSCTRAEHTSTMASTCFEAVKTLCAISVPHDVQEYLEDLEKCISFMFPEDAVYIDIDAKVLSSRRRSRQGLLASNSAYEMNNTIRHSYTGGAIAYVVVLRSSQIRKGFSAIDIETLDFVCRVAEFNGRILFKPSNDGSVQTDEVVTPTPPVVSFLLQVIPHLFSKSMLLQEHTVCSTDGDVPSYVSYIVQWVKTICQADMALLRLKLPQEFGVNEVLVSSEDKECPVSAHIADIGDFVVDASENSVSDKLSNQMCVKFLGLNGELNIIRSDDDSFPPHSNEIVLVMVYLLTSAILVQRHIIASTLDRESAQQRQANLEVLITELKGHLESEKSTVCMLLDEKSSIKYMMTFTLDIAHCDTVEEISNILWEKFPKCIGATSCALYIRESVDQNSDFSLVAPTCVPVETFGADFEHCMSWAQLKKISNYSDTPGTGKIAPYRSKILLQHPKSNEILGAILFAQDTSQPTNQSELSSLQGILCETVSTMVVSMMSNIEERNCILGSTIPLSELRKVEEQRSLLSDELESVRGELSAAFKNIEEISREKCELQAALETNAEEYSLKRDQLSEKCSLLERSLEQHQSASETLVGSLKEELAHVSDSEELLRSAVSSLGDMIQSFSVDSKCNQEGIVLWLREIATDIGANVYTTHRGEGGELALTSISGGSNERIYSTDVYNAAKIAIRDCKPHEIATSLGEMQYPSKGVANEARDMRAATVLCIPNRLASSGLRSLSSVDIGEPLCYIFVRPGSEQYTDFEKTYLVCVVGIICKAMLLMFVARQRNPDDIEQIVLTSSIEKQYAERLKHAVSYSCRQWAQSFNSWSDLYKAAENGAVSLLSGCPKSDGEHLPFSVQCVAWQPGARATNPLSGRYHLAKDAKSLTRDTFEHDIIAHKVVSTGLSHRSGNTMWIPLKLQSGEVIAVLCLERTVNYAVRAPEYDSDREKFDIEDRSELHHSDKRQLERDSLFTGPEEEMMNMYATMAVGALDRIIHHQEALISVQKASRAILALQNTQESLESRVAMEVAQKLKFQESLKFSSDILSSVVMKRLDMPMFLDSINRLVLTVSSSHDCFIIVPFMPGEEHESKAETNPNALFTINRESGKSVEVQLEPMDIEYIALKTQRVCRMTGGGDYNSWAARNGVIDKASSITAGLSALSSDATEAKSKAIHAIAVPCSFRDGSSAVVVVLRKSFEYDNSDESCLCCMSKVISCAMDMIRDQLAYISLRNSNAELQRECDTLDSELKASKQQTPVGSEGDTDSHETIDGGALQAAVALLQQDLVESLISRQKSFPFDISNVQSAVDMLVHCTSIVFQSSGVEVWSAADTHQHSEDMDAMLLDSNERTNRDAIHLGRIKVVMWEEASLSGDGRISSWYIKAVFTFPDVFDSPMWLKIRKHPDDNPSVYRIKFLFTLMYLLFVNGHSKSVRQLHETLESRREEYELSHLEEVSRIQNEMRLMQETFSVERAQFETEKAAQQKSYDTEIEKLKLRLKSTLRHQTKEKRVVLNMMETLFGLSKFVESCSTISKSNTIKSPKKLNITKLFRKICDILGDDGCVDVAAAIAKSARKDIERHKDIGSGRPVISTADFGSTYLTWISPSTHWIGTSSPMSSTSPIAVAYTTKRIIVVTSSQETLVKHSAESPDNPKPSIGSNEWSWSVNDSLPDMTIVVPFVFPSQDEEYVLVVKPRGEHADYKVPIATSLAFWSFFRSLMKHTVAFNLSIYHNFSQRRGTGLQNILLKKGKRDLAARIHQLSRAFSLLKSNWIVDKLSAYSYNERKYIAAKKHIRVLERSVADWAELVRGVNGASSGISRGLTGLWGQACRPLMSMITSHVTLRGCGLLVASEDEEIMDLNVEELSAFDHTPQRNFDGEGASISIRPATELGSNVQSLAWNILNGQMTATTEGNVQRLWKLSRSSSMRVGADEQMWLVPLRTATEVLGVVRVAVDVVSDDTHNYTRQGTREVAEYDDYSEEDSTDYGWAGGGPESAKRNIINFAEIFAPMVTAARQLEIGTQREKECEDEVRESFHKQTLYRNEVDIMMARIRMLASGVSAVSRACVTESTDDDFSSTTFAVLCSRIQIPLAMAMDFEISMLSTEEHAQRQNDTQVHSKQMVYEPITNEDNVVVGYICGVASSTDNVDKSSTHPVELYGESDDDVHSKNSEKPETYFDSTTVSSILRILATSLSGYYISLHRELSAKFNFTTAVASMHKMQHELEDQSRLREECSYREVLSSETSSFNNKVADIMRECAMCDTQYSWNISEPNYVSRDISSKLQPMPECVGHTVATLLMKLCKTLPTVFRDEPSFIFGVLCNSVSLMDSSEERKEFDREGNNDLMWYDSEGVSADLELRFPDHIGVSESTVQIAANLARASISKGTKSCVDIEVEIKHSVDTLPVETTVRVLSIPLIVRSNLSNSRDSFLRVPHGSSFSVGVLQVFLHANSDKSEVEALCSDISLAVAGCIYNDRMRREILRRVDEAAATNTMLASTLEDSSKENELLRYKSTLWNSVSLYLCEVVRSCSNGEELENAMLEVQNMLSKAGITLSTKKENIQPDNSVSGRKTVHSQRLVYLGSHGSEKSEIELECTFSELGPLSGDFDNICGLLSYYFTNLSSIINSRDIISEDGTKKVKDLSTKLHALEEEYSDSRSQCQVLSEKLAATTAVVSAQSDRIVAMKGKLPRAIEAVLKPLQDNISMLLASDMIPPDEHSLDSMLFTVDETEKLFNRFAKSVSAAVSKVLGGSTRPYHVAVLVRSHKSKESKEDTGHANRIVVFDGLNSSGTTHLTSEEEENGMGRSSVHECFSTKIAKVVTVSGSVYSLMSSDLIGLNNDQLNSMNIVSKHGERRKRYFSTVMSVPLVTNIANLESIVRIIFCEEDKNRGEGISSAQYAVNSQVLIVKYVTELICSMGKWVSKYLYIRHQMQKFEKDNVVLGEEFEKKSSLVQSQLSKCRRMYKYVCREAINLIDPPTVSSVQLDGTSRTATHAAILRPLLALQDSCLKTLTIVRNVTRSDGQAILLQHSDRASNSYELIFTGSALSWPGIEEGSFGVLSASSSRSSLAETVISSQKSCITNDASHEHNYMASVDGQCSKGTPMLIVPLRGPRNAVIGVVIAARNSNRQFSTDDSVAVEMVASFCAISVHWSNGLKYIHEKLSKSVKKMEELENSVKQMKKSD